MKREIKFRAWDKQYKKMVIPDMLLFSTMEIDYIGNLGEPKSIDHFELMQFTGLKDKNGKEIYEGDIIKGGVRIMHVVFRQDACQIWMIWNDGKIGRYEPLNATYGDDIYFSNDGIEVIGNIYENPELLTK